MAPYDAVSTAEDQDDLHNKGQCCTTVKGVARRLFPVLNLLLYLSDVVTNICYAVVLFSYAKTDEYIDRELPLAAWGSLIIVVHVVSGFCINLIATLNRRSNFSQLGTTAKIKKVLLCFVPEFHVIKALGSHAWVALAGDKSVNAVEWAAFTRLLHTMMDSMPQAILQTYFFLADFEPKDTLFATWVPVASMAASLVSSAVGYTFFVVYKYYDQQREYPHIGKSLIVALTVFLILGGRTMSLSLLPCTLPSVWVMLGCLAFVIVCVFVFRTVQVLRRKGKLHHRILLRLALTLTESFCVASSFWATIVISLPYVALSVSYIAKYHTSSVMWILFSVTFSSQVVGVALAFTCSSVYREAYADLLRSIFPEINRVDKKEQEYPQI